MRGRELLIKGNMKKLIILAAALSLMSCGRDAQVASRNLSYAADNFELNRRIVFYNGITADYILTIEGRCSVTDNSRKLSVTCKTGPTNYKKHYLGLSNNVTYFSEQTEATNVSIFRYKVVFKPSLIIPDIDAKL